MTTRHPWVLPLLVTTLAGSLVAGDAPERTLPAANPPPERHAWHPHNKIGLIEGAFLGIKNGNRALIRDPNGTVMEVPLFHLTMRDLSYILNQLAQFPAEVRDPRRQPDQKPVVDLKTADLPVGPLLTWTNCGAIGGAFHSMNHPPVVEDVLGRKGVRFDYSKWYIDPNYSALVSDILAPKTLAEGKPFTLSAWVLHPEEPDGDDPEVLMSWHSREGNHGTAIDWKLKGSWGSLYVAGLGGDLHIPDAKPRTMPAWTHLAYVYTGGQDGEFRVYVNGTLKHTARYDRLPSLRPASAITATSAVLNAHLDTADNSPAYLVAYLGTYDAHYWMQLRHIGQWDMNKELGRVFPGDVAVTFDKLKPGTRYYYRMLASGVADYANYVNPTRRWANGAGSFVTATADGKPGYTLPVDQDQFMFLGVNWGSRWYGSYPGPSSWFRGYIGDLRLYDRALDDLDVRDEAGLAQAFGEQPPDGAPIDDVRTDLRWTQGAKGVTGFRVYLSDRAGDLTNETARLCDTPALAVTNVDVRPGRTYYWRVDQLQAGGHPAITGAVWTFRVTKGEPSHPFPEDGSTVNLLGDFRWQPDGSELKEQRLFLAQSDAEVRQSRTPLVKLDGRAREAYKPEALAPGKTCFWRIETVQPDGAITPGTVWSFTVRDDFEPEFDGPSSEPFFDEIRPGRQGARVMEGLGNPTITTPGADEATLRDIAHATKRYLRKSPELRRQLEAHPCATTMDSPEGAARVNGFACGSYGGMPGWWMTMHEMGHQVLMNGLGPMAPDFYSRLNDVFLAHADNNAWLGDYAASNIHENMAVSGHQFISGRGREALLREDPPTYYLLADYLPGDLCIELHPAWGLAVDADDHVVRWDNRGGVEDILSNRMDRIPETTGSFAAVGAPERGTVQGATAVRFSGRDALAWDLKTQYGFEGNRAWSVEFWARRDTPAQGDEVLLGWGPEADGARFVWGSAPIACRFGSRSVSWASPPVSGQWNHIVYIFGGGGLTNGDGSLQAYVNGALALESRQKLALAAHVPVWVGGVVDGNTVTAGFHGALAHVRAHNYALSRDQVLEHFAQEKDAYRRPNLPDVGGTLYVDLDAEVLQEPGTEDHRPLYSPRMNKPWVRSWANHGTLQGRVFNDISAFWHYSGSTPLHRDTEGVRSLRFMGKDRMVATIEVNGRLARDTPGTLEAWLYVEAPSANETILEWGDFRLDSRLLKAGWQHVGVVAAANGRSDVYVDGQKTGDLPGVLHPKAGERLRLGAQYDPVRWHWSHFFNGAIQSLRVHQTALTPEQLARNARLGAVALAHAPVPPPDAWVVAERHPTLSWTPGTVGGAKEMLYFGESAAALKNVGVFAPGAFRPPVEAGKTYAWRVGDGPVWSFATRGGTLVDLSTDTLATGKLAEWMNAGRAAGRFVPAEHGDRLGPVVQEYAGQKGIRLVAGKVMTASFGVPACLTGGTFTVLYRVANPTPSEAVPILSWGEEGKDAVALWFGTWNEGRKCMTWGGKRPAANDKLDSGTPYLPYPGGNTTMAYFWKTFAIACGHGKTTLYLDGKPIAGNAFTPAPPAAGSLALGFAAGPGEVLLRELRIYDAELTPQEVERACNGEGVQASHLAVNVNTESLATGKRVTRMDNQGTLKGAFAVEAAVDRTPTVADRGGRKAVVFDGRAMLSSDFLLPEALCDGHPFSVEMWAWSDADADARLLAFGQEVTTRYTAFAFGSRSQRRGLVREFGAVDWNIDADQTGRWVHLAWVYDGGSYSKVRLYRDGQPNAERSFVTLDTLGGYPLYLGGIMHPERGEKALFRGGIASVRIYDYARSDEELAAAAREPR